MGLFSFIPVVGDLIDAVTGQKQQDYNNQALSLEQQKLAYQQQGADRLKQIFEQLWGKVKSAEQGGMFDPNARVERATERFNKNATQQQKVLGAGLTAAGYKPTDSEVAYNTNRLARTQAYDLAQTQDQAAKSALEDELNAYRSTDPSLVAQAGQIFGNAADSSANLNLALGQQNSGQGLGGLFSSILPFFTKGKSGWSSSSLSGVNPVNQGRNINYDGQFNA